MIDEERKIVREKSEKQQMGRERSLINNYSIFSHTISLIGLYSSKCQNYLTFDTSHEACFLGFGVSNAKYLALSTFDTNALKGSFCCK